MSALTSWYVDAARRRLHEAVGDLLVVGVGEGGVGVVGALLRVAGVEVVDLVPRQVRLTQLQKISNHIYVLFLSIFKNIHTALCGKTSNFVIVALKD